GQPEQDDRARIATAPLRRGLQPQDVRKAQPGEAGEPSLQEPTARPDPKQVPGRRLEGALRRGGSMLGVVLLAKRRWLHQSPRFHGRLEGPSGRKILHGVAARGATRSSGHLTRKRAGCEPFSFSKWARGSPVREAGAGRL